jgi:prepilin peptidase CpaA
MIPAIPQLALITAGLVACWTDLRTRRIPNLLCALTLGLGLAYAGWSGGWHDAGNHALHAMATLGIGAGLFATRAIGGGDAKFYAAVAAWFTLHDAVWLFVLVSCSGIALLIAWFAARMMSGRPIRKQGGGINGLPYGVAIAAGGAILILAGVTP